MSLRPALVQLFLKDAYLCVEKSCETISNDSSQCPRCHSAVMLLAKPVNREQTHEETSLSPSPVALAVPSPFPMK